MSAWAKDNRVALENDKPRVDIIEKVTGRARYTTDYYPPNLIHAAYIRCPYGKASVQSADVDAAKKVKGVLDCEITNKQGNYHGDRLGHICAESQAALEEGLRALKMKFDIQPAKTQPETERRPLEQIEVKDPKAAEIFKSADVTHEATYSTQVQTHSCPEPHSAVVDFKGDKAVAYGSTQGTFQMRDEIARALEMRQEQVEFHCEHVGGGFGSKLGGYAEGALAAKMSKKFNRPCRVVYDRKEEHLDTGNRPGSIQYMKIALGKDGSIKGGRIHVWGVVGPKPGGGGAQNPKCYNFGTVDRTAEDVALNAGFPRPMRAPGWPQGMFAVAMCMDEMAAKLGIDPLEFRLKNEESDIRREMMKVGAERIGWKQRKPNGQWPGVVKRGFGIGAGEWGGGPGKATIEVALYRDGNVEVRSGSQDIGTGFRTVMTDCVASQLGVPRERVQAKVGVSIYPPGPSSGGSVTTRFTAHKAFGAAEKTRQALIQLVAKEWNVSPESVSFKNDTFQSGAKSMPWAKACKLMTEDHMTFTENQDGAFWKEPTGSCAVQFVDLSVDTETGIIRLNKIIAIQDCGQPVNRMTAENQICGGVIQGISFALFEDRILNRKQGSMVNANLEMYKIAGPRDVPEIVPILWKSREDVSPSSLGEPPTIPTSGAIGCAVANAIGAPVRSIPITPAKVLAALGTAKGGKA
jgi:xanthine dehydrogenase YagR molybdenum-binding subunit